MKRKIMVVAAIACYGTLQAQTETTGKNLDEVVVTASKTVQKQSQTGKVVTVINQAALQNNVGKSLSEILNRYVGVFVTGANNAPGSNQDLYLRGAATGNALILLDGVPVQDPSLVNNTYDLNNIDPAYIERIEILKGSQSTLWGSGAVAGVVNIITKKSGSKKISPNASVSYGSYNTWRVGAGVNGHLQKLTYNLAYNYTNTDGFSAAYDSLGTKAFDKDGLKQNSFLANLGYQLSPALNIGLTSNYGKYKAATDAGAYTDDYDASATSENFATNFSLNYKKQKTNIRLVQSLIQSGRMYLDDSTDKGTLRLNPKATYYNKWSLDKYKGQSLVTEIYGNHNFSEHASLIVGLQYTRQKTDQSYKSISNFGPYNAVPVGSDTANTNNFSGYASFLLTNLSGFNLEVGGRLNRRNVYGSNATFTFNPSYKINDQTSVFLNLSSGYNIPTLYQLYSEYGNKELKPESSLNYEIGVRSFTNDNKNSFRIVAFKRDVKNLIVFVTDPTTFASKYINQNQQNDYGFEIESNMALDRWGQWISNFTYVAGKGLVNGVKTGNLFRRPNSIVNSALTLQLTKELTVVPAFRYVGERKPGSYDVGPNPMEPYYTIDLYAAYAIKQKVKLFIDLRNITDQKYFDIYGYNSRRFNFMTGINASL